MFYERSTRTGSVRAGCQVLRARGSEFISVVFNVSAAAAVPPQGLDCESLGLGYMTLPAADDDSPLQLEGRIYRDQQYDMRPLRVSITGHIARSHLDVEYHDDDGMQYVAPASDLLDDDNQVSSPATPPHATK